MAKNKYCYVVLNRDNGKMILEDAKLPIYYNKKVAQGVCKAWGDDYCVHPIILEDMETFVLNGRLTHPTFGHKL